MLSEKKPSNKASDNDYFKQMSDAFEDVYNSVKSNKTLQPLEEQVNNFTKQSSKILGDTFNLNPDPFANPNPTPYQNLSQFQQPNILSQAQQPASIMPQNSPESLMEIIKEPSKTFSGLFSSSAPASAPASTSASSASQELFKAPQYTILENIITVILLLIFIVLIGIYATQYFYGIDIIAKIKNIFTNHPEIEIKVEQEQKDPEKKDAIDNDVSQIMKKPQVFNIPENEYVYEDAKAVCKAYGARLATYQEVEESYNKGGEWCNYGWSDGQMALFPTQQKTFDELQKIEGHENDCGRPGVNGGFIDNPKLKYGVNCYGYKPRINKIEKELMETSNIYPRTKKDIAMDERVEYWKERLSEVLISPFNHDKWSKI
jgi:hypothetical protein